MPLLVSISQPTCYFYQSYYVIVLALKDAGNKEDRLDSDDEAGKDLNHCQHDNIINTCPLKK